MSSKVLVLAQCFDFESSTSLISVILEVRSSLVPSLCVCSSLPVSVVSVVSVCICVYAVSVPPR